MLFAPGLPTSGDRTLRYPPADQRAIDVAPPAGTKNLFCSRVEALAGDGHQLVLSCEEHVRYELACGPSYVSAVVLARLCAQLAQMRDFQHLRIVLTDAGVRCPVEGGYRDRVRVGLNRRD